MKRQQQDERLPAPPPIVYSDQELEDFGRTLIPFREEVTLTNGEKIKVLRLKELGCKLGLYTKRIKQYTPSQWKKEPYEVVEYFTVISRRKEYLEFHDKYDQWQKYMDKNEITDERKTEELQKLLDTSGIGTRWGSNF